MENNYITSIELDEKTRTIKVFFSFSSDCIAKDQIEMISLACNYNASYSYSSDHLLFTAKCNNDADTESLLRDYKEYFYSK